MDQIKQSWAWWSFSNGDLVPEALVRAAAEIGYTAVDLAPREHWQLIKDHGLELAAVAGHASIIDGLNDATQHDRIERELRANLALAAEWRIPNLICFAGSRRGISDAQGADITATGLRRVVPLAEELGVTLAIELLNSKVDHPDYQADHTAWGAQVCQMIDSPRVRLLYDVYHMQITEGDLIRSIQTYHPWISHYHTAGNPGRHEIGSDQEINYPAVFRAIGATGYTGYIAHEFTPTGSTLDALRAAFELCRDAVGNSTR